MAESNAFFLTEVETEARETVPVQVTGQKFLWPFSECWMISSLPPFLSLLFFFFLTGRETGAGRLKVCPRCTDRIRSHYFLSPNQKGFEEGLFLPGVSALLSAHDYHLHSPPGLKRGVCVKINHFPEDTDYDHDSAEYLLRTWGSGTEWGDYRAWASARGEGAVLRHLEPHAEMNLSANPSPDTEILWSPIGSVVSPAPSSHLGAG